MKGQTGIWLDGKKAMIVHVGEGKPELEVIESEVEYRRRFQGESKEFTRFGNQYMTNEEKDAARIRTERIHFLESIILKLDPGHDIVITGPAKTKTELAHLLADNHAFSDKPITVKPLDTMTENQFIAWVDDYFHQVVA